MERVDQFGALFEEWQRRGLDRRRFLRLVAIGTSAATLSSIIAACGGAGGNPSTSAPAQPTRPAGGAAAPPSSPVAVQGSPTPVAQTVGAAAMKGNPQPTAAAFVDRAFLIAVNVEPDSLDIHDTFSQAPRRVHNCPP